MRNGDDEDDAELLSGCEKSDIAVAGLMLLPCDNNLSFPKTIKSRHI